ncbi:hypothetical protein D7X55_31785 [Corallococcus sp. AB049A]|uniref:Uncharacterized protein n=1 Tax=Corallococcus interemptor TaxID=2316720 RepID=A0A3A8QMV3_9BACT|nr:hypothetical protein D7Y23_07665 [Corallococcus sp. AB050B]RKH66182.1 hypothetical protein D7X96_22045 [Corallococcus interemptor]RKI53000.1 hypothetical protein D7X55_31785 [Corallococcus sp. AB049A]
MFEQRSFALMAVRWHVPFTGGLVVARDSIPGLAPREKSVVSSVSSPIWMFSEVREFHFVEGQW